MSSFVRRVARVVAVTAVTAASAVVLGAPAGAAPVQQDNPPSCSAPRDGVIVCLNTKPDPVDAGYARVWGSVQTIDGSTLQAGMVAIQTYTRMRSLADAVGQDTAAVLTEELVWGRGNSYLVEASWVDAGGRIRSGVLNTDS